MSMTKEEEIEWIKQKIEELNKIVGSAEDYHNSESTGFSASGEIKMLKKRLCELKGESEGCSIMGGRRYKKKRNTKRTTKRRKSVKKRKSTKRRKSYRK
jgi:hypothetical protein